MKRKLSFVLCLILALSLTMNVSATRRRQVLDQEEMSSSVDNSGSSNKEHSSGSNIYELSGYSFNGQPVIYQDFSNYPTYAPEEIQNISEAIMDCNNWDAFLGALRHDSKTNILSFTPYKGGDSNVSKTIGYSLRKFGAGEYRFRAKLNAQDGLYNGWLGICLLCTTTQNMQWSGNPGYLLVLKQDAIELQKYFPDQEMLEVFPNGAVEVNKWHEYVVEINPAEVGYELALTIDGKEMFRYLDDKTPYAPEEGYFNLYCGEDSLELMPMDDASISSAKGPAQSIALKPDISYAVCDGEQQAIDAADPQVVPLLENGRVLVPLRFLSEKLGAMVSWDDATQTATIVKDAKILKITPGFAEYQLDGVDYPMDVPARIEHGRTLVPVRFIAEAFEKNVIWEDEIVWITEGEEELSDEEKAEVKNILK